MQINIIKFSFVFLCFFYSGINIIAQEKIGGEKVAEIIAKSKKVKWKHQESFTDNEGHSLRRIVQSSRIGAQIFWNKKWVLHGIIIQASNGIVTSSTTYEYGQRHGEYIGFYENGEIERQTNFKNDLEDGSQYNYKKDGKKESYKEYVGGERNGVTILYYSDGETKNFEYEYKDNKPLTRIEFNKEGEKNEKCTFDKKGDIIQRHKFK